MPLLSIRGVTKSFGTNQILKGVDLDVNKGEVVSIIGASGSGKTTLLRCVNLLEDFDGGEIILDDVAIGYVTRNGSMHRLGERELRAELDAVGSGRQAEGRGSWRSHAALVTGISPLHSVS